jgi:hypothetical protein
MSQFFLKCKKISKLDKFSKRGFFIYSKEVVYKYNAIYQEKTNDKLFAGEEGKLTM